MPPFAVAGETGIAACARLAFDDDRLFVAIEVPDDSLSFPERSWRFGDGIYLTVLVAGTAEEDRTYVSFGFSRVGGRLEKTVVNRNGEYFPRIDLDDVDFAMHPGPAVLTVAPDAPPVRWNGAITYEAAVPWKLLAPAHPLLNDTIVLNIVIVDRRTDGRRRIALLTPDPDYDTERTSLRRGRPVPLQRREEGSETPGFAAAFPGAVIDADAGLHVRVGARPGGEAAGAVHVQVVQAAQVVGRAELRLSPGPAPLRAVAAVPLGRAVRTGPAVVRTRLELPHAGLEREDSLFVVVPAELAALADELDRCEADGAAPDRIRAAIPAARIRLDWIDAYRRTAAPNASAQPLLPWWMDVLRWSEAIRAGNVAFLDEPGVRRVAHRSRLDGTLQPYSIVLPAGFDGRRSHLYPVLLALHGSGVTEEATVRTLTPLASARGWVVVAPQGRGLSDWWIGAAEQDALEALEHALLLHGLERSRVYVAGFSMGGYGAYRLALRHPDRFRAAVVMAGAARPPAGVEGEPVPSLLAEADNATPPFLIMHGARDQAVAVEDAQAVVRAFADQRRRHEYREFADLGHGSAAWWRDALDWFDRFESTRQAPAP